MTSSTICSHHRIRTVLLMCVVLLSASLHAQAQNKETRINLNIRNATLESFVKQLENATGFSFIYGEEVKLTHRITLEMKQKNISEILQRAFENEPITFEISGKHILLHKRPVPQKPVSRKFTISGYVTDGASSETLIGANILESRRSTGTATNPFGFYSLTLPEGETELVFSYLGYESRHSRFELTKDTLLNVRLDSNNQLAEVVVLSDKREAGIESTAMGAHEIPMTQIRHTPSILGEADLLKTIQLMPGVQAGMEGFAGMYVRGGGPDQNLVMLDGIPVYNADHLLGVFSIFTPEAVKNTTLFKSSFPARYGGRLSSIVDVRTNDGDMHKYHGAFSIGLLTDKLHIEGPIWKERTSFSFSARAIPTLFFKNLIVDKDDTYSDKYNYYFYDVNAKVNHKFSDRSRIFLSFYKGKDHYHYDSYYHGDNYDNSIKNYSKDNSHLNWGNTIAYGRWNYVFNSKLFCNTTVSYNKYEMGLDGNMEDTYTVANKVQDRYYYSSKFNSGIRDWSARMDFDYTPMPQHHIKFGAEYIHHTFRPGIATSKIQDIDNGALQEDTVYNTSNSHAMRGQEISLYAEDNFNVNARFSLNAGVRTSLFHTQGKSYYSLQPRLSARYDLGQGYSAKASYTCMAQYVHLLSSTPLSMPTDLWVPITKDISPMYANQFSIGGYYSGLPGWEFSVEGYYKQMKHILEYQDGVSFFGTSTNWEEKVEMGEGRSFGLELMVQKTLGKTTGWLAYTLSKTDHRFKNQIFGTYAYMPPEQVNRMRGEATVLPTTDIFSFGVLAFQLLTGSLPFGELSSHNELALYQKRGKNGDWNRQKLTQLKHREQWQQLFAGCLNPDFKKRFQSVQEVLEHLPAISQVPMERGYCPPQTVNGFCIRIMQGEEYGKIYQLSELIKYGNRILTIGRERDNLLHITEQQSAYISRHHCTIETNPATDKWIIRDGQWQKELKLWQESSNGTYVNSTQVTKQGHILKIGDIISIGDVKMRFENY